MPGRQLHEDAAIADDTVAALKASTKTSDLQVKEGTLGLLVKDARPVLVCVALMVFQQLSGINAAAELDAGSEPRVLAVRAHGRLGRALHHHHCARDQGQVFGGELLSVSCYFKKITEN